VNFYPVSPGLSYAKTSSCEDPEKWEMDWVWILTLRETCRILKRKNIAWWRRIRMSKSEKFLESTISSVYNGQN
jgi:hypothetical protein